MIQATNIRLWGPPGPCDDGFVQFSCLNSRQLWDDANACLLRWRRNVAFPLVSCLVEFDITYRDGRHFNGDIDLVGPTAPDLGRHLRDIVALRSGDVRSPFLSRRFFAWVLDTTLDECDAVAEFGRSHDLGPPQAAPRVA